MSAGREVGDGGRFCQFSELVMIRAFSSDWTIPSNMNIFWCKLGNPPCHWKVTSISHFEELSRIAHGHCFIFLGIRIGLVRFRGCWRRGSTDWVFRILWLEVDDCFDFALNVDALMSPNQAEQHPNSRQLWVVDSRHQQERWMDGWMDRWTFVVTGRVPQVPVFHPQLCGLLSHSWGTGGIPVQAPVVVRAGNQGDAGRYEIF